MQSSEVEHGERLRCHSESERAIAMPHGVSDRDASWSERNRDATRTSDRDATRSESSINLCGGGSGRQR